MGSIASTRRARRRRRRSCTSSLARSSNSEIVMRFLIRAGSMALTLGGLAVPARAQAPAASTPFKIAYVNTEALMAAAPGRVTLDSTLQREAEAFRAQLKKLQDSLNALVLDFQKKEATLNAV